MKKLFILCSLMQLGACASMFGMGEDSSSSSRSPASSGGGIAVEDTSMPRAASQDLDRRGPNLGQNEFSHKSLYTSESSQKGFRRGGSPWDGVGSPREGSLWDDSTQDNFYFSKNVAFRVGDILIVNVDKDLNDALNARISAVINKRTAPTLMAQAAVNAVDNTMGIKGNPMSGKDAATQAGREVASEATKQLLQGAPTTKFVAVDEVPVRVIEALPRGLYRVQGGRRVIIKGGSYQLKFEGVIRSEEVEPTRTIASSRVLESKMEVTR